MNSDNFQYTSSSPTLPENVETLLMQLSSLCQAESRRLDDQPDQQTRPEENETGSNNNEIQVRDLSLLLYMDRFPRSVLFQSSAIFLLQAEIEENEERQQTLESDAEWLTKGVECLKKLRQELTSIETSIKQIETERIEGLLKTETLNIACGEITRDEKTIEVRHFLQDNSIIALRLFCFYTFMFIHILKHLQIVI